jgi:hypothetical protein
MARKNLPDTNRDAISELLSINNPTPCFAPVNSPALFAEIVEVLKSHIVMSHHSAIAMALWIIHTYCYRQFAHSPLLLINAPERACGKSVALGVVARFVPRPLECANISVAALFRVVENRAPTVLIDEADTFLEGKSDLAGILNKGYEQGGMVLRVETIGDRLVEVGYRVFGPKALAGIALELHLPDATMSRGIQIPMRRKVKGEVVQRLRGSDPAIFASLRSQINRFVQDHEELLNQEYLNMPEELDDRAQDCWVPLFTIASCISPEVVAMTLEAALATKASTQEPQSTSNNLLADIREVLTQYEALRISTADLLEKLIADPDMGWNTCNKGFPLEPRQLAKNLRPYGIAPKTVRMSEAYTPKGYEVHDFKEAFDRYLKPLEVVAPELYEGSADSTIGSDPDLSLFGQGLVSSEALVIDAESTCKGTVDF